MMGYLYSVCRMCGERKVATGGRSFRDNSHFCEKHTQEEIDASQSAPEGCGAEWVGRDRKDHSCSLSYGHDGKCVCSCGERDRVVNKAPAWEPKPFYKRRKVTA